MHDIWGERFLNNRGPAWHGLGLTVTKPVSALEAFNLMGPYTIRLDDLYTKAGLSVEQKAIVREATGKKDEGEKVLGFVNPSYNLITPIEAVSIYDVAVEQPVETIGALQDGALLFVSVKLEPFDVKGDEIQDYLLVVNPMNGLESAQIVRTPIRVVCANTLRLGLRLGQIQYRIRHNGQAKKQMHDWLKDVYAKAVGQASMIKEACELLANYQVSDTEVTTVLNAVYPEPTKPKNTAPAEIMQKRYEHREYIAERQAVSREQVKKLFHGDGTGMNTVAAKGSAWGLANAVVEWEDYRWSKNPQSALESAVFGARADVKDAAFEECMELVGAKQ